MRLCTFRTRKVKKIINKPKKVIKMANEEKGNRIEEDADEATFV